MTKELPKIPSDPNAPTFRIDVVTTEGAASTLNLQLADADIESIATDPAIYEAYKAMISRQATKAAQDNALLKAAVQISRAASEISMQAMNSILELHRVKTAKGN